MKIDPRIEPLVRTTLNAAVKADEKRFGQALAAFADQHTLTQALQLTGAIVLFVLHEEFEANPGDEELRQVADDVVRNETWAGLTPEEVLVTLTGLLTGRQVASVEPQAMAVATFVIAGYLLASSTEPPKAWFEYLDEVEAALERK
jgi:hypothetical protein